MPQGDKSSYTTKQKRQAHHIEDSEKKSGKSSARAKQIGYATVNKMSGGGKKTGSGRKGVASKSKSAATKSASAKKVGGRKTRSHAAIGRKKNASSSSSATMH